MLRCGHGLDVGHCGIARPPLTRLTGVHDPVRCRVALGPPALGQRTEVDRIEADLVEESSHGGLRISVVARDRKSAPVSSTRRSGQGGEVPEVDVVERLHDSRISEVRLEHFGRGRRLILELGDPTVPVGVVVHRVDHHFAVEWVDGHVAIVLQRDRHHHDVTRCCGVFGGRCARVRTEFGDEIVQRARPTAVAHHDAVIGVDRQTCDGAPDVATPDESPCRHGTHQRIAPVPHSGTATNHGRRWRSEFSPSRALNSSACSDGSASPHGVRPATKWTGVELIQPGRREHWMPCPSASVRVGP